MLFTINPKGATPIYIQLMEQIKYQIASGRLRKGDRLPTVRDLATRLRVNPNTVAKAYHELERESILEGRPGQGSYVKRGDRGLSLERRQLEISRLMEVPVVHAYHLALAEDQVTSIFQQKLTEIYTAHGEDDKGLEEDK